MVPVPLHTALAAGAAVPPTETGVTAIVNCAALAVVVVAQLAVDVNWQSIVSPLARLVSV